MWAGVLMQTHTILITGTAITANVPVAYVSRLFWGNQLNWATLTKDAFAIFCPCANLISMWLAATLWFEVTTYHSRNSFNVTHLMPRSTTRLSGLNPMMWTSHDYLANLMCYQIHSHILLWLMPTSLWSQNHQARNSVKQCSSFRNMPAHLLHQQLPKRRDRQGRASCCTAPQDHNLNIVGLTGPTQPVGIDALKALQTTNSHWAKIIHAIRKYD